MMVGYPMVAPGSMMPLMLGKIFALYMKTMRDSFRKDNIMPYIQNCNGNIKEELYEQILFSIILIILIIVIIVIIMIIVIIAHSARYWLNPLSSVDADACAWISYVRFLYYHHHHNHNYHHNHHNYHHHHYDNNHHGGTQGNPASSHMGWRTLPGPPQPWHVSSISITIQHEKNRGWISSSVLIKIYYNHGQ